MKYERYIWFIDKSMTTHQFVRACDLQFLKKTGWLSQLSVGIVKVLSFVK